MFSLMRLARILWVILIPLAHLRATMMTMDRSGKSSGLSLLRLRIDLALAVVPLLLLLDRVPLMPAFALGGAVTGPYSRVTAIA